MSMNKTVVRRMIKRISTVPESYDQGAYFVEPSRAAPCGTVACLAGEAVICSVPDVKKGIEIAFRLMDVHGEGVVDRAEKVLGLVPDRHTLFDVDGSGWPAPFAKGFSEAVSPQAQANVAVAYLREALKRGTMTW